MNPVTRPTVLLSPDSSPQYYSYYIDGFIELWGGLRVRYSTTETPRLDGPRDGLAMVLPAGERVFIAADDHPTINHEALDWCDVYGQVNFDPANATMPQGHKLTSLGPGFGVQRTHAARSVLRAWARGGHHFAGPVARVRAASKHQLDRLALSEYRPSSSSDDTLFFLASYWHKHPEANDARRELWSEFHRSCKLDLIGGFVNADPSMPPELCSSRSYDLADYLTQTQRSVAVLNTPAVHGCLGWKLGEFFALGKAIVSLPLTRAMPGPFQPGEHAVVVANSAEAVDAAHDLAAHPARRRDLEHNARQYFDDWLSPVSIARRLTGLLS
jgi:hypothetical protein